MVSVVENIKEILVWKEQFKKISAYPHLDQVHHFSPSLCHSPAQKFLRATSWASELELISTEDEGLLNKIISSSWLRPKPLKSIVPHIFLLQPCLTVIVNRKPYGQCLISDTYQPCPPDLCCALHCCIGLQQWGAGCHHLLCHCGCLPKAFQIPLPFWGTDLLLSLVWCISLGVIKPCCLVGYPLWYYWQRQTLLPILETGRMILKSGEKYWLLSVYIEAFNVTLYTC